MAVAKRIIVYILAAALSVGFIVPSVSADAFNEGDYSLIPLFSDTNEYYVYNNGLGVEQLQDVHRVWSNGYSYVRWDTPRDIYVQQIYFSVVVPSTSGFDPTKVFALINGSEKQVSFVGSNNNIFYFRLDHYNNVYSIQIGQNGTYFGDFTIYDIYGTVHDLVDIWEGSLSLRGFYVNNQNAGTYMSSIGSISDNFPISLEKKGTSGDTFTLLSADGTLVVSTAQAKASFVDYFIFDVYSCGTASDFGAVLLDDEGNVEASLQVDTDVSGLITEYGVQFGSSTMHWPIYRMQVVVKTENFNLAGKSIQLVFSVDGVRLDSSNQNVQGVYAQIVRGFARPTYVDEPWYANIVGWMKRGFQSIVDKLDEVFNGDSTAADDLENMEDQLEELTPTINNQEVIDNVQGSVNEVLPEEELNVVGGYFKLFFEVLPRVYFILPFTLALIGYLLFGKRS